MSTYRPPGGTWTSRLTGAPAGQASSWTVALRNADTQAVVIAAATGAVEIDAPSGNYAFTFTLPGTAGVYEAEWVNGSTKVVDDETVEIPTTGSIPFSAAGSPYFDIAYARKLKPLEDTSEYPDDDITEARQLVEQAIEDAFGVAFVPRTTTEKRSGRGRQKLRVRWPKVTAVTAVTITYPGGGSTTYDSAQLAQLIPLDPANMVHNPAGWPFGHNNVQVTYEHGFASLPLEVKRVARLLTRHRLVESPFDERTTRVTTDGGTIDLLTAGGDGFELPALNALADMYGGFRFQVG